MNREFKSIFADDFRELIAVKRALGFKYLSEEGLMHSLPATVLPQRKYHVSFARNGAGNGLMNHLPTMDPE